MNTSVESEPFPKLGLAEITPAELPNLEVVVRNAKAEIVANVGAQIVALIVSPQNHVLYLESACTSDAGAHALMGSVSDPRGAVEFRFYRVGDGDYVEIQPPDSPRLANVRLAVAGYSRHLHHVAILDRSGELMLTPDDETLWRKLREKMTCPTLEEWGTAVMKEVHWSGMLLECEAFGVPEGLRAFVLAENAQKVFDGIIAVHVELVGIPGRIIA
ncbi:MAG TPA: hypothetical protein VKX17_13460 [Planctomycetota bacterium]|nr:hypothetical protein [Planctomycetota bacterium]